MNYKFGFSLLILLLLCSSCFADNDKSNDWRTYCPSENFCFEHPNNLKVLPTQPIDSIAGKLQSENANLYFDLGSYPTNLSQFQQARTSVVAVDGHKGKLFILPNALALTVSPLNNIAHLTMIINFDESSSASSHDYYQKVFHSITLQGPFKAGNPQN